MKLLLALLLAISPLSAHYPNFPEFHKIMEPKIMVYRDIFSNGMPRIGDEVMIPYGHHESHVVYFCVIYDDSWYEMICEATYWYEVI